MKNKITLTGDLGSGKSLIGNMLAKELKYQQFYTGKIQREIAERHNMTTLELNNYAETHSEIDDEIDAVFKNLQNSATNCIIDSRLAWFFIPDSFKIYLNVDINIAAQRIMQDTLRKNESYLDTKEAIKKLQQRKKSENKRYIKKYNVDDSRFQHFDLIIDTSFATPQEITSLIIKKVKKWQSKSNFNPYWMSPRILYPSIDIGNIEPIESDDDVPNSLSPTPNTPYITKINNDWFILDHHKDISHLILKNINLIPVYIKDIQQEQTKKIVKEHKKNIINWEKYHNFKFITKPTI